MGCFTTTPELTQEFFSMGVPVWQIREKSSPYLYRSKLLYQTKATKPTSVNTERVPGHSALFDGVCWSGDYLAHLHEWSRHHSPNGAVGTVREPSSISPTHPSVTGTSKKRKRPGRKTNPSGAAPASSKTNPPMAVLDSMTQETRQHCIPGLVSNWELALKQCNTLPVVDRTFYVPDPSLFASVAALDRLQKYVAAWLKVRSLWLKKVDGMEASPPCSTTKRWKSFFMAFFRRAVDGEDENQSRIAVERRVMQDFLGLGSIEVIDPMDFCVDWNGQSLSGAVKDVISHDVIREVVWELHELNFRMDLARMERFHFPSDSLEDVTARVGGCFPGRFSLFRESIDRNELGLSSPTWALRAVWIIELGKVLQRWPNSTIREEDLASTGSKSPTLMLALEKKIALLYCSEFGRLLGRAAVVPAIL